MSFFTFCLLFAVVVTQNAEASSCTGDCSCSMNSTMNSNGSVCEFFCDSKDCKGASLTCSAGYDCEVDCDGEKSCKGATISANGATTLDVVCTDSDGEACKNLKVDCDTSICSVDCSDVTYQSCASMTVDITNAASFSCYDDKKYKYCDQITYTYGSLTLSDEEDCDKHNHQGSDIAVALLATTVGLLACCLIFLLYREWRARKLKAAGDNTNDYNNMIMTTGSGNEL